MSRTIKFRVWDNVQKVMFHADKMTIHSNCIDLLYSDEHTEENNWGNMGDKEPVIMQYTGLNDKKGKEIYEGDIIEWRNGALSGTSSISRQRGHFQMDDYFMEDNAMINQKFFETQTEVIGNLHQHPELLEGE